MSEHGEQADSPARDGEQELERRVERLHDVATHMQTATEPDGIYDLTVEAAVDILGFDWCAVQIATGEYFEVVAVSEQAPVDVGARPITTDHGITGTAFERGESILTDDAHSSPEADPTLEQFRSGLTIPIGDHGVFQCVATETGFFDDRDLELAELLIAHTTAALDRVGQSDRLSRLTDATRRLMSAETHDEVAREGCRIAASILAAPEVAFYRLDGDADLLVPVATSDAASEPDEFPPIDPDEDPGRSVLGDGASTVRVDGETTTGGDWSFGPGSLVTAVGEHGLLSLGSDVERAFGDDDVALVETLAANIEAAWARADRERTLREQTRRLQRQNDRLDRFASVVSHDLRNPLNIALARTELAAMECESEHLEDVGDALDRMETIIKSTLSLAREGQTVEKTERVSLARVATESWAQVETDTLALDVVDDTEVLADPDRLRTVFENLFRNSAEHGRAGDQPQSPDAGHTGDAGQEPADIHVRIGPTDGGFYVEDTGSGIPESERERIFELGYAGSGSGTGFGMAIVQEIVNAHGWKVRVAESDEGGARFEITGVDVQP